MSSNKNSQSRKRHEDTSEESQTVSMKKSRQVLAVSHTGSSGDKLSKEVTASAEVKKDGSPSSDCESTVRVNIKYRNETGRTLILCHAVKIHYDFGDLNGTLSVSIPEKDAETLKTSPDIDWSEENNGAVEFLSHAGPPLTEDDLAALGRRLA
jgi:hypothetical protein